MDTRTKVSMENMENNAAHQLILNIHRHIFESEWTWIGFLGDNHKVCLETGSWSTCLPKHVKQQWDSIENYLSACHNGCMVNPEKTLQEIVSIGVQASRLMEKPRRHPTTDLYYLMFNEYAIKGELIVLKRAFGLSKNNMLKEMC